MIRPIAITLLTLAILWYLLPGVNFSGIVALILASIVLTILYGLVRPVLQLLFLPVNIVTMGLFSGVINVFLLWLATFLVPGFSIGNLVLFGATLSQFWSLVVVGFFIAILHSILKKVF